MHIYCKKKNKRDSLGVHICTEAMEVLVYPPCPWLTLTRYYTILRMTEPVSFVIQLSQWINLYSRNLSYYSQNLGVHEKLIRCCFLPFSLLELSQFRLILPISCGTVQCSFSALDIFSVLRKDVKRIQVVDARS